MLFLYLFFFISLLWGAKRSPKGQIWTDAFSRQSALPLRGFFMLLVVFHHLSQQLVHPGSLKLLQGIGLLCVSYFFFQSGYGLTKSYRENPAYFHAFFRRRYCRLLTPFFLCNLIYLAVNAFFGISYEPRHFLKCLAGLELVNTHAWFILTIALFTFAFYVIFRFVPGRYMRYVLLFGFQLLYSAFCMHRGTGLQLFEGPWWFNSSILFLVGVLFAGYEPVLMGFMQQNYRLLSALSAPLFVLFYLVSVYAANAFPYQIQDLSPLSPRMLGSWFTLLWQSLAVLSFCMTVTLFSLKIRCSNPFLRFLGKISVELYLIHGLFIQLFKGQLFTLENDFLFLLLVPLLSVPAAWLLYLLLEFLEKALLWAMLLPDRFNPSSAPRRRPQNPLSRP